MDRAVDLTRITSYYPGMYLGMYSDIITTWALKTPDGHYHTQRMLPV